MIKAIRNLFRPSEGNPSAPAIPEGERVYAVGDIHGRLDLFTALVHAVDADDAGRVPARTTVVLLGDLIDRGPDSAGVIAAARDWQRRRRVRIIIGNHEEMLLRALDHDDVLRSFLKFGGRETALSYPIDAQAFNAADFADARDLLRAAIPAADLAFIRAFENAVKIGDYLFVHAGIAPEVPLEEQREGDLRWIREPFLSHRGDHGFVVVHGHTITAEPQFRPNRIGLDTGAFSSGRLTAIGLAGTDRWLIEARDQDGAITTHTRSAA
ncbi:serine/threonine protein phosphatase [Novosphingobium flavum]|uniref:Serine/threonine protein phosphatase n=1 Tax=Novosphingobium flavum TaxID=1778672 RepID=A0A7X1FVR1_9SPHN|nr:metallophosphoesterase [Novosphingobium flavum]MBC2667277.1 serine/threonine protein phosphatase [Novosphingobium flavum]